MADSWVVEGARRWQPSCVAAPGCEAEAAVTTRNYDEWTIARWKTDTKHPSLDLDEPAGEVAPPLWKDVTLASIVALGLWAVAAAVFW
jgi:hypothetical protein